MHATILANGDLADPKIDLPPGTMLIAADGGGRHCLRLGLVPQVVIGDFDSLTQEELAILEGRGAALMRYPADKDETDLELALDYAVQNGAHEIALYGLLGGRWDMTLSNLLLLASPRFSGVAFHVIDGETEMFILRGGDALEVGGQPGDTVSLIPWVGETRGLTYEGLEWPLTQAILSFGTPRGVSNRLSATRARIRLDEGVALVVIIHA